MRSFLAGRQGGIVVPSYSTDDRQELKLSHYLTRPVAAEVFRRKALISAPVFARMIINCRLLSSTVQV
jgi:hypothetical protein